MAPVHREPELTDEEKADLDERMARADEDEKQSVPMRQLVKEGRAKLQPIAPR